MTTETGPNDLLPTSPSIGGDLFLHRETCETLVSPGEERFSNLVAKAVSLFEKPVALHDIASKVIEIRGSWIIADLDELNRNIFWALKNMERDGRASSPDGWIWELDPLTRLALEG
jgi:hypothetical protein